MPTLGLCYLLITETRLTKLKTFKIYPLMIKFYYTIVIHQMLVVQKIKNENLHSPSLVAQENN